MTDSDSAAPLHWKFSQVFGQRLSNEPLQNDDVITTVAFEKHGDYIAVGDRGGRIIVFERDDKKKNAWNNRRDLEQLDFATSRHPEFRYKTEFQSHEPEIITSAEFHPLHCNLLAYSSSQDFIRLSDLQHAAICDHASRIFQHGECYGSKSFFTEITSSISDIKFLNDGQHLISRNYMNMKLWDMRMESSPVATFKIHEHLRSKLPELYNNDCIFDKFECCFSGDGLHFATGSYSNLLRIFSPGSRREEGIKLEIRGNSDRKALHQDRSRVRRRHSLSNLIPRGIYQHAHTDSQSSKADFSCNLNFKLLHVAWQSSCMCC